MKTTILNKIKQSNSFKKLGYSCLTNYKKTSNTKVSEVDIIMIELQLFFSGSFFLSAS